MDIQDAIAKAQDAIKSTGSMASHTNAMASFFIPAAVIRGGGGGGGASDTSRERSGSGGGYGINARPVGAYVIDEGHVRWEPAVDVTGITVRAMVTALGLALLLRRLFD